ncbi:Universal stress protein A [wastewater metagenome]|uniref:Universal stress protein A n=2 Tax=unclassified sequences TaxID=12908 RepID=A0A6A7SIX4_9ZZZZ|nr:MULTISPECIES: universal stress protein [Arhodomonas]MCS4502940.1 universal stress protein [Arhodomonas aquaeolei]QEA07514.1 universal stress protein A [uncultured organism]QEA07573.1 universal stress protein A [uncultured organism]
MEGYQHILLAADFQDDSACVGLRARDMAERYGARLSLLHVVENMPVEPGNELMIPPTANVEQELLANAERRLRELGEKLGVAEDDREVRVGQTKREIIEHAQECGADLIVVGSHSRHGLALLLGSTANALLHGAPCDVLAVRL